MPKNSPSTSNHLFCVLRNGDVIYKFNDLHFVVRSRKRLEREESMNYISQLSDVYVHEPTPTPTSNSFLERLGVPVFSQLSKQCDRYYFREDYRPYIITSLSKNSNIEQKGILQLYVLAGCERDYKRTKFAFKWPSLSPLPYHDYGMVSLLVYVHPDESKRPFLSLITGDCSTKRVKDAIYNAAQSGKIPYFRCEEEEFFHCMHPLVELYHEKTPRIETENNDQIEVLREVLHQPPDYAPDPIPQPKIALPEPVPYIDEDSERHLRDSGMDSMETSESENTPRSFYDSLHTIESIEEEEEEEESVIDYKSRILSFDVIHMPPNAEKLGRFLQRFKAEYYILPTGKYNGFTSGKAVELNKNIRSGCRVIPMEQTVDHGWHDGKIKIRKAATGMKHLYKIFEPIRVEEEPSFFKEHLDPYGKQILKRTLKLTDYIPPPDVYEQQTVVVGGYLKGGVSFPLWPERLHLPRKIQKVYHIQCVCVYCRYNIVALTQV